jgi:hypothetical protein
MNSNLLGILQQLFRGDAQGLANRRQMVDTFGKYLDNFAQELRQPKMQMSEKETPPPANIADEKKERLREAYLLGEAFDKPLSMRED